MATITHLASGEAFSDPLNVAVSGISAGEHVVVAFKLADADAPVTVTDNQSNIYSSVHTRDGQDSSVTIHYFLSDAIGTPPTQVTINPNALSFTIGYSIWTVSGLDSSAFIAGITRATGTSTSPSASYTATTDNEAVLGFIDVDNDSTVSSANGFTPRPIQASPNTYDCGLEKADAGTAGSKTIDATLNASRGWAIDGIRLRNASGGGSSQGKAARLLL